MIFPKHKCGLTLEHNPHAGSYMTVGEYLDALGEDASPDFGSPEDRDVCIANNEYWTLCWYPYTPVGSYCVAASTLEGVLKLALKTEAEVEAHV